MEADVVTEAWEETSTEGARIQRCCWARAATNNMPIQIRFVGAVGWLSGEFGYSILVPVWMLGSEF